MNLSKPLQPLNDDDGDVGPNGDSAASGASSGGDFTVGAAPRRKLSLQTIIVIITLAGSAGALYMMRQKGKAAGLKLQPVKLDLDVDKLPKPRQDHAKILKDLALGAATPTNQDKLNKNPFEFVNVPVSEHKVIGPAKVDVEAERIRYALGAIEINAIMQGRVPVARINGKLVQTGDIVEEVLKVVAIHERSIDFAAGGAIHSVTMGERPQGARQQPPRPGSQQPQPPQPPIPRR